MMRGAYSTLFSGVPSPEDLGAVSERRRPACFPLHAQFARPCFPVMKGTRDSVDDLHRHCPECGRCYDCADGFAEMSAVAFDRRTSTIARIM
jgi:hypothetical protein